MPETAVGVGRVSSGGYKEGLEGREGLGRIGTSTRVTRMGYQKRRDLTFYLNGTPLVKNSLCVVMTCHTVVRVGRVAGGSRGSGGSREDWRYHWSRARGPSTLKEALNLTG